MTLVNQAMQRKFWPNESAIGKRFRFGDSHPWVTIVGVVGDIRQQSGIEKPPSAEMYLPAAQDPTPLSGLVIRTMADPKALAQVVRREIRAVDKDMPIIGVATMEEVLDREVLQRRAQMLLLSIFAAVALLLASLGIYGVLAYLVSQRTQEIGIRMALGAGPRDVLLAVAGQGMGMSIAGIALGVAAAWRCGRSERASIGYTPNSLARAAADGFGADADSAGGARRQLVFWLAQFRLHTRQLQFAEIG